jgi:hypothetical protein
MSTSGRRTFLKAMALGVLAPVRAARAAGGTSVYLAYTSFAVRLAHGRDILGGTASALDAVAHLRLCRQFGSRGAQVDFSQLRLDDRRALASVRAAFEEHRVDLELSIPARYLETPEAYATAVDAARALGAARARVALLSGRRYESFETRAEWDAFAAKWRETLPRMRREFDRHRFAIAIENHKDWLAADLVSLLRSVDSPFVGLASTSATTSRCSRIPTRRSNSSRPTRSPRTSRTWRSGAARPGSSCPRSRSAAACCRSPATSPPSARPGRPRPSASR